MFIIYILSSLIGGSFTLNMYAIIMMLAGIIAGAIGRGSRSKLKIETLFKKKRGDPL